LRCLGLVGMVREQRALYACLRELVVEHPDMIESSTVNIWKERVGAIADGIDEDAGESLEEVVKRCYAEIDVRSTGSLDVEEWIRFVMLQSVAPCLPAAEHLDGRLKTALLKDPNLLERLLRAFEEQDVEATGKLPPNHWQPVLEATGAKIAPTADLAQDGFLDYFDQAQDGFLDYFDQDPDGFLDCFDQPTWPRMVS